MNPSSILSFIEIMSLIGALSTSTVGISNLIMTITQKEKHIFIPFFTLAWVFVIVYLCVSSGLIQNLFTNIENTASPTIISESATEEYTQKQTLFDLIQQPKEDNIISKGR